MENQVRELYKEYIEKNNKSPMVDVEETSNGLDIEFSEDFLVNLIKIENYQEQLEDFIAQALKTYNPWQIKERDVQFREG